MLALTKKTDYALIALAHLAEAAESEGRGEGGTGGEAVSARGIAQRYDLPLALLTNVLKDLGQARLVRSSRGASGGYRLAVDPARTSLLQVVEAIEGPLRLAECCDGSLPVLGQACRCQEACPIRGAVQRLHGRLVDYFAAVTLRSLFDEKSADDDAKTPVARCRKCVSSAAD